jgi:hypothetical protein
MKVGAAVLRGTPVYTDRVLGQSLIIPRMQEKEVAMNSKA